MPGNDGPGSAVPVLLTGGALLGIGALLRHSASNTEKDVKLMRDTRTSTFEQVANDLMKPPCRFFREVYGRTWCPSHAVQMTEDGQPAIRVQHDTYEVTKNCSFSRKLDSDGRFLGFTKSCSQRTDRLASSQRGGPVFMHEAGEDVSGMVFGQRPRNVIRVDEDCIDLSEKFVKAFERFEQNMGGVVVNNNIQTGGQGQDEAPPPPPTTERLGYKHVEKMIPLGKQVYALGDVMRDSPASGGRQEDMLFTQSEDPRAVNLQNQHIFEYGTQHKLAAERGQQAAFKRLCGNIFIGLGGATVVAGIASAAR